MVVVEALDGPWRDLSRVTPVCMPLHLHTGFPGGRNVRNRRGARGLGEKLAPRGRLEPGIGELAHGEMCVYTCVCLVYDSSTTVDATKGYLSGACL